MQSAYELASTSTFGNTTVAMLKSAAATARYGIARSEFPC